MTALPCENAMWTHAAPCAPTHRGTRPKATLMLKLRALDDEALAELEAELAVYQRAGIVCQRMAAFMED